MPKHPIKAARAASRKAKAPIHGGSELALKGDISGRAGLCSELERRMSQPRAPGKGGEGRPPGFNPGSVYWSHRTLGNSQSCSAFQLPKQYSGKNNNGSFPIRWL